MNNSDTTDTTDTIQLQESSQNTPSGIGQKGNTLIIVGIVFLIAIVGMGAYFLGTRTNQVQTSNNVQPSLTDNITQAEPTNSATQSPKKSNSFGVTTISFAESGGEIYLKHTIDLYDPKVEYPNSKLRTITNIYTQDDNKTLEPIEASVNAAQLTWTELVDEPIEDSANSISILVSDSLFSFKKIPNSNSFLFVVDLNRGASTATTKGAWSSDQFERTLYFYDRSQMKAVLKKIETFTKDAKAGYPKIISFSQNGGYVSVNLFGCWGCGGHVPQTLLLDLQTLKTKNIGAVLQFSWGQNGAYTYKDYVVIECKEPQPGKCNQDPNILPLKTG